MMRGLIVSFLLLLISAGVFIDRRPATLPVSASAEEHIADYERAIQAGVAERVLALNKLGKAEILSAYQYARAEAEAADKRSTGGADFMRSLFGGRFVVELGEIIRTENRRLDALQRAKQQREQEARQIRQAYADVMSWDFHRYAHSDLSAASRRRD